MKKCERCGLVDIPKKLHYCDECRMICKKEVYERKLEKQRNGDYQTFKGGFNFLRVENKFSDKLSKQGTIRLCIAIIKQAKHDGKWKWLESDSSDIFFDLAEIDKKLALDKFKRGEK